MKKTVLGKKLKSTSYRTITNLSDFKPKQIAMRHHVGAENQTQVL